MDGAASHSQPLGRSRSDFEVFYAGWSDDVYGTLAATLRNSQLLMTIEVVAEGTELVTKSEVAKLDCYKCSPRHY
jgi:hypothetical protein